MLTLLDVADLFDAFVEFSLFTDAALFSVSWSSEGPYRLEQCDVIVVDTCFESVIRSNASQEDDKQLLRLEAMSLGFPVTDNKDD